MVTVKFYPKDQEGAIYTDDINEYEMSSEEVDLLLKCEEVQMHAAFDTTTRIHKFKVEKTSFVLCDDDNHEVEIELRLL